MIENQISMVKKIDIMEKWVKEHLDDDKNIRMNAKERMENIIDVGTVVKVQKDAKAVLRFMQRGGVFDMPKEILKERSRRWRRNE